MAGSDSIAWDLGNAPKQSITEVLQNPRGPTLELPELSSFDLSAATSLALSSPIPATRLPDPLNINHFEPYLRRYAHLHTQFRTEKARIDATAAPSLTSHPPDDQLVTVPEVYFDPAFSVAKSHHLAALQPPTSQSPSPPLPAADVATLRTTLASYRVSLEHQMRLRLAAQSAPISAALARVRHLRAELLSTASALHDARTQSAALVPAVSAGLRTARAVAAAQANVRALRDALAALQLVLRAPDDVALLLRSAEYAAAITTVHNAKRALAHRQLASVLALGPAKARLAQAVEAIDAALREEFRTALRAGKPQQETLREVVSLVALMGRLPLLRGFFLKEIKTELAKELKVVDGLHAACREVKASAERALMLISIIHTNGNVEGDEAQARRDVKPYAREVHDDLEEMLSSVVDRFLGSFSVSNETGPGAGFVVITGMESLREETCFDEFKGALKFGEEVRSLEEVAKELNAMFSSDKKSSTLRAKISERQSAFLSSFHKAHVEELTQTVKTDRWQEVAVPSGAQRLLTAVMDNPEETTSSHAHQNGVSSESDLKAISEVEVANGAVVIGKDVFKTVTSGVRYLRSVCAYALLAEKSPSLAPEIARRATELSRLFNSLVGRAILGAAALQWSGLRSITARHLSLASRTVAMAAALADRVDRPLERALSTSQVDVILPLIQRSEKDLREHHGQLLAKILAIMMDRLEAHEGVLNSLPWDKAQEMKRFDTPSAYIATLVKEASVLHRILWSILPTTEVCDIFQRVCAAYGTHLTESYSSLDGGKKWIRSRVAEDVTCLHDRLLLLDVFKATPDAFRPVQKLYIRFAKEVKEAAAREEAKGKVGRMFIRPQQTEQSRSVGPVNKSLSDDSKDTESKGDARGSQSLGIVTGTTVQGGSPANKTSSNDINKEKATDKASGLQPLSEVPGGSAVEEGSPAHKNLLNLPDDVTDVNINEAESKGDTAGLQPVGNMTGATVEENSLANMNSSDDINVPEFKEDASDLQARGNVTETQTEEGSPKVSKEEPMIGDEISRAQLGRVESVAKQEHAESIERSEQNNPGLEKAESMSETEGHRNPDPSKTPLGRDSPPLSGAPWAENDTMGRPFGNEAKQKDSQLEQGLDKLHGIGSENEQESSIGHQKTDDRTQTILSSNGTPPEKETPPEAGIEDVPEGDLLGLGRNSNQGEER